MAALFISHAISLCMTCERAQEGTRAEREMRRAFARGITSGPQVMDEDGEWCGVLSSNRVLSRFYDQLEIGWNGESLVNLWKGRPFGELIIVRKLY